MLFIPTLLACAVFGFNGECCPLYLEIYMCNCEGISQSIEILQSRITFPLKENTEYNSQEYTKQRISRIRGDIPQMRLNSLHLYGQLILACPVPMSKNTQQFSRSCNFIQVIIKDTPDVKGYSKNFSCHVRENRKRNSQADKKEQFFMCGSYNENQPYQQGHKHERIPQGRMLKTIVKFILAGVHKKSVSNEEANMVMGYENPITADEISFQHQNRHISICTICDTSNASSYK